MNRPPTRLDLAALIALGIAAAVVSGCDDPTVGIISGSVTVDGQPVETGSIAFFPTGGDAFTAGGVIAGGQYSARVPLGELRVEIRVPKQVGEQKLYDVPDSPLMPILDEALPAKYNNRSELSITVEPGRSKHDFALTSE
ncbi:MAG: hypothetical protein KC485_07280 [Gemmatimonadetes bacterium]|nr:hypothetical protein [Planctomycetales bacterium]MCA9768601.1 hypothetical protein [Gemmatimonadota bacterium]